MSLKHVAGILILTECAMEGTIMVSLAQVLTRIAAEVVMAVAASMANCAPLARTVVLTPIAIPHAHNSAAERAQAHSVRNNALFSMG